MVGPIQQPNVGTGLFNADEDDPTPPPLLPGNREQF